MRLVECPRRNLDLAELRRLLLAEGIPLPPAPRGSALEAYNTASHLVVVVDAVGEQYDDRVRAIAAGLPEIKPPTPQAQRRERIRSLVTAALTSLETANDTLARIRHRRAFVLFRESRLSHNRLLEVLAARFPTLAPFLPPQLEVWDWDEEERRLLVDSDAAIPD